MKDEKNTKNESAPFSNDPFSVDVWERAYKNVGRPFEKQTFAENEDTEDKNNISSSTKNPAESKKNRQQIGVASSTPTKRSENNNPEKSQSPTVILSHSATESYLRNSESNLQAESSNNPIGFMEMIENAFDGDFTDIPGKIKEMIKNSFGEKKISGAELSKIIWPIIAFIVFIIFSIAQSL